MEDGPAVDLASLGSEATTRYRETIADLRHRINDPMRGSKTIYRYGQLETIGNKSALLAQEVAV